MVVFLSRLNDIPYCIPLLLCYYCAMVAEVCKGWTSKWRITDRDIRQSYRGMHVEPGFYSSPLKIPPKDAFFQHTVEKAIIVWAEKTRSSVPETVKRAA